MTTTVSLLLLRGSIYAKHFTYIILFNPDPTLWRCYSYHFTVQEAESWDAKKLLHGHEVNFSRARILAHPRYLLHGHSDAIPSFS